LLPAPLTSRLIKALFLLSVYTPHTHTKPHSLLTILSPSPPPKVLAHALQHLAAGIMICAIAMELVMHCIALLLLFSLLLLLML
jgi:hypothetical protein